MIVPTDARPSPPRELEGYRRRQSSLPKEVCWCSAKLGAAENLSSEDNADNFRAMKVNALEAVEVASAD